MCRSIYNPFSQDPLLNINDIEQFEKYKQMQASPSLSVFLVLMLLLHQPVAALNWQGTGNLNNDNLTVIWAYIHSNFKAAADADTYHAFNTALSDRLNDLWAPAWNIIIVKISPVATAYNDVVLYGYAFRDHWMWFNGYTDPLISGKMFSFVIWKDYNCQSWKNIGYDADTKDRLSGLTSFQKAILEDAFSQITISQIQNDPWGLVKAVVDQAQASNFFVTANNHAYSAVFSQQYTNTRMYGRVCVVDSNFYYSPADYFPGSLKLDNVQFKSYGILMLFQTR